MNEALTIKTERVDDIPLLLAQMQRMGLVELLDKHFPTHGNRVGLSLGWVTSLWLTHVLSQADHRMNHVQSWAEQRLETLRGCSQVTLEVSEDGLLQLGHSKDHRPDLPQLKVMLATLDPLGMPLATEVVAGRRADDPLYLPAIARVRTCLKQPGWLYVGDCKMAALDTRASIQAHGDYYLCPLSAVQVPAALLAQQVEAARASGQSLMRVERTQADGQIRCIAQGYEQVETITTQLDGLPCTWTERRLLVQSMAAKLSAEEALHTRLKHAQQALSELTVMRQGKAVLAQRTEVEQAVADTLAHFRVDGLLLVTVNEQVQEQAVRAYRGRPATVRIVRQFTITSQVQTEALRKASEQLGWRVYATNHWADKLPLTQAVEAYRDEYLVERNFGRLKGHPLSLSPMYVERDDHATGLVRLLSIALRVLTLLEFVVRRHLAQQGASLAGLYAGNPKRATTQPTTERLLDAFQGIFLTVLVEPHQTRRHLTALSALQQRVLALLEFSPMIYSNLCEHSSEPP